ncbi:hypothetical protein ACSFA8_22990 [Variovorax sp. RT4R15]|uniref:hypothetical protein n=1 Tax=Variovorax sp. RT4R15 TaxID=3443737 RepID=UPI003F4864B0
MSTRCVIRTLMCVAVSLVVFEQPLHAQQRVYLTKAEIEQTVIGKGIVSRNLASGMLSHWEFRSDGRVSFVNQSGPGSASGTWVIHEGGLMCVTMVSRTGCRYWFKKGDTVANTSSNETDAPTVAVIRFE